MQTMYSARQTMCFARRTISRLRASNKVLRASNNMFRDAGHEHFRSNYSFSGHTFLYNVSASAHCGVMNIISHKEVNRRKKINILSRTTENAMSRGGNMAEKIRYEHWNHTTSPLWDTRIGRKIPGAMNRALCVLTLSCFSL